jgi:heat shock protein HspQ
MSGARPRFDVGDLVQHRKFGYRGVIVDVDAAYRGTEDWYRQVALSRPPKDRPWYHVLVHEATHTTYVAERHLERDPEGGQIEHPALGHYFGRFTGGRYILRRPSH